MGLPGMILGWQVAKNYGTGNAIGAICIGNLLLWLVGLVIISMSTQNRTDAIANIQQHLGKASAWLAAIILMGSFIFWFSIQIKTSVSALHSVLQMHHAFDERSVQLGAAIGLSAALLATGGIRAIKWVNVICLPLFIGSQIYLVAISDRSRISGDLWGISFAAITSIVLYNIICTSILPTFFRHSRSLADSFLALTTMAVLNSFFQISSIWIGFDELLPIFQNSNAALLFLIAIFLVLITICNLLINIYFASASWEATLPNFKGPKEYAIIGLSGTAVFIFFQISPPMIFLINLVTDFVVVLSIVLLITYLAHLVVRRQPVSFGKLIGSASWLIGCITFTILKLQNREPNDYYLFISMGVSVLFFISTIFLEETVWSFQKIFKKE